MPHLSFFGCMLTAATSYAVHISNHGLGAELALADEMFLSQQDWDAGAVGTFNKPECCVFTTTALTKFEKCMPDFGSQTVTHSLT